ncbi:unnamed protein product [Rhizophagus irregularis]|nr:unnamed protein product [Rhizophagus irregularis]
MEHYPPLVLNGQFSNLISRYKVLESTRELEEAINENVCVLLVGHFQSGKSSTLLFEKYQKELFLYTIIKNIIDFDKKNWEKYGEEMIVIMIDEFDQFLLNIHHQNDTVYQIDKLPQELSQESQYKKQPHSCLQQPVGIFPNLDFSEKVVDDIYSCTNGYAGLEGLFASLCIEYASNKVVLDFSKWNERFTEFIRNPPKRKISAIKVIEKYLTENTDNNDNTNTYIKDVRCLLEHFLQRGSLPSSEFNDNDI